MNIIQPYGLDIELFPHQLYSLEKMEELEASKQVMDDFSKIETSLGINADIMGYGKTISMVALVLRDKMEWNMHTLFPDSKINIDESIFKKSFLTYLRKINTTLVLVNKSMVKHWVKEFSFTKLSVHVITGLKNMETDIGQYDVVIVIPSMFNKVVKTVNSAWKRFIFDEPSSVRVPKMMRIVAGFVWFVTAMPEDIYNNHILCKSSYMYRISKYLFNVQEYITIKNNEDFVLESFKMPKTNHINHQCYSPVFDVVNGIVNKKILKLVEAGNIDEAIEHLGGSTAESIIDVVGRKKNEELEEIKSRIKIWTIKNNTEKINKWKLKEEKINLEIIELKKRADSIGSSNCAICYDVLNNPVLEPKCQNVFCSGCLLTWLNTKSNCPLCRKDIKPPSLIYIKPSVIQKKKKVKTKEDTIIEIIKSKKGKFLIFSDYFESFFAITKILDEHDIPFVQVKGKIGNIDSSIDKYKNGDIDVMFMNSKTDNTGLNLENTTDLIFYHSLEGSRLKQVIGRANRIGRKTELNIHYLTV